VSKFWTKERTPRGLEDIEHPWSQETPKFLVYVPSIRLRAGSDHFGNRNTCFPVRRWVYSIFSPCKNAIKATHELNSSQHVVHCTVHSAHRTPGIGLCEHAFGTAGSVCGNKFWSWNVAYENYEM
jgi:hypothetical protein